MRSLNNAATSIRIAAFAVAAVVVGGGSFVLGSYSNAKSAAALAAGDAVSATQPAHTAFAPSRINVVGKRGARTAA